MITLEPSFYMSHDGENLDFVDQEAMIDFTLRVSLIKNLHALLQLTCPNQQSHLLSVLFPYSTLLSQPLTTFSHLLIGF